jgi:hypothetical protein
LRWRNADTRWRTYDTGEKRACTIADLVVAAV